MIERLSQRDRIALAIGAAVVALALIYSVVVPYRSALHTLDTRIAAREHQLGKVQALMQRYRVLQQELSRAEHRLDQSDQPALGSFIEDLAGRYAAKENLASMRPQPATVQGDLHEDAVEVHLEKVRLSQVIQMLYAIDNAPASVKVKNLHIKTRFDDKTLVDAIFTVAAYRRGA